MRDAGDVSGALRGTRQPNGLAPRTTRSHGLKSCFAGCGRAPVGYWVDADGHAGLFCGVSTCTAGYTFVRTLAEWKAERRLASIYRDRHAMSVDAGRQHPDLRAAADAYANRAARSQLWVRCGVCGLEGYDESFQFHPADCWMCERCWVDDWLPAIWHTVEDSAWDLWDGEAPPF